MDWLPIICCLHKWSLPMGTYETLAGNMPICFGTARRRWQLWRCRFPGVSPASAQPCYRVALSAGASQNCVTPFNEFIATAPDELTIRSGFLQTPDGQTVLFLSPTYCGSLEMGEQAIAPLRTLVQCWSIRCNLFLITNNS